MKDPAHHEISLLKHYLLVRKIFFGSHSDQCLNFHRPTPIFIKAIFELLFFKKRKRAYQ